MVQKENSPAPAANARERLIEAAMDIFGQYGFDIATTRMIAAAAEVNIASIPYYFSGKEGLYQAAVSHIVGLIEERLSPVVKEIGERSLKGPLFPDEALSFLEAILGTLIEYMVGSTDGPRFARIILREHLFPSSAYDIIFSRMMEPMVHGISTLIGLASGETAPRLLKLRAVAVVGQVMAFRIAREAMVRGLGMEGYSQTEVAEIKEVVLEHTRRAVGIPADFGKQGR